MRLKKFMGIGLVPALRRIAQTNSAAYNLYGDFEKDIEMLQTTARTVAKLPLQDRTFLWMGRELSTYMLPEHDVFLRSAPSYIIWTYYNDPVISGEGNVGCVVEVTDVQDGEVVGNLYMLNYAAHVAHVKLKAVPSNSVMLRYEDGERIQAVNDPHMITNHPQGCGQLPDDEKALSEILREEREERAKMKAGDIIPYLATLAAGTMQKKSGIRQPRRW